MKLMKSIAAAASLVVAVTSTAVVQPNANTANNEVHSEIVGATADEVFNYAVGFEGWKLYDFRANGWETNDSYWCAWYASTMLMDCNVPFPVPDFNLRIWVADILAGYLDEGRYIHTSSNATGFVSQGGGRRITPDMLTNCQDVYYTPVHGDLLFFDWGGDGLPDHIGFVDYVDGEGRVHTLEGNPGILNGVYGDYEYTETQVSRVNRSPNYIIGYAKPDYIPIDSEPADASNSEVVETTESTAPKILKITFTVDEGVFCDEHDREITWGTCTYDFPTPYKPNSDFDGWVDGTGNIITCDSLITEDTVLYAKFKEMTVTTPNHSNAGGRHEMETTQAGDRVIAVEAKKYSEPNVEISTSNDDDIQTESIEPTHNPSDNIYQNEYSIPYSESSNEGGSSQYNESSANINWIPGYNIGWKLEGDVFTITGNGEMPYYYNPSDAPWISIGSNVKKAVIEEGVTTVGGQAFTYFKNMSEVSLPSTIKVIGRYAFQTTPIQSISLPNGLERIEQGAFHSCNKLTSITVPNSVFYIDTHAFAECSSLSNITLSTSITSIGDGTFEKCTNLKSLVIPSGVQSIGAYAFWACNLEYLSIPQSLGTVGYGGFYDSVIGDIYYGGSEAEWNNIDVYNVWNQALHNASIHYNSGH